MKVALFAALQAFSECRDRDEAERVGDQLPAHRIVNSSGYLSGAGSFEYPEMQKLLLEEEGVSVRWTDSGWRVNMNVYGWKNTLEEAEELRRVFEMEEI